MNNKTKRQKPFKVYKGFSFQHKLHRVEIYAGKKLVATKQYATDALLWVDKYIADKNRVKKKEERVSRQINLIKQKKIRRS